MVVDLRGKALPDVALPSTFGRRINPARVTGHAVYFVYPWTGRDGHENPQDWDAIAGAHGSTPQALAYNGLTSQYAELETMVFGLSSLRPAWQLSFALRNSLQFPLLSDEQEAFSRALNLDWFRAGARQFLQRRTLIVRNGVVIMDRRSLVHPEDDAGQTLALLRAAIKS